MASQGPLLAGAGADDAAVGANGWVNPGNITADDAARAIASNLNNGEITHYLKSGSHGFTIPAGSVIDGIIVEVDRSQTAATTARDSAVRIVKADGSIGSTNKGATSTDWPVTTDAIATYGSSSDLWGETWTPANINDADFGAVVAATNAAATNTNVRVDFIRITVHYTAVTAHTKSLSDTLTATDATAKSPALAKADTLTASDAAAKGFGKPAADTLTASDAIAKAVSVAEADTLTASDALAKAAGIAKGDTLTASDAFAKAMGLNPADTLTASDLLTLAEGFHLGLSDTLTASDVFSREWDAALELADTLTLSDLIETDHDGEDDEAAYEWFESAISMHGFDMESSINLTR